MRIKISNQIKDTMKNSRTIVSKSFPGEFMNNEYMDAIIETDIKVSRITKQLKSNIYEYVYDYTFEMN